MLLTSEQRKEMINMKNKDSNTCLHVACAHGYEDIANLLMEKGADVKSRNYNNETPLHLAAYYGQNDVVDNIIDIDNSTINDNDSNGNSPLHMAAESGNFDVIKYLLKSGASINDKNALGLTPLEIAASNGQTDAAKALIWGGAASGSRCESTGLNALHYASIGGHSDMIEYLLEYCDIEETDLTGRNALDHAIDNLNKDAVYSILSHRDWKLALRNKTIDEDKKLTTPLRKLIKRMPDVAQFVFDRCINSPEDLPVDNPDYELVLNYEFIDDVYNDWPCDIVRYEAEEGQKKGDVFTRKKIQRIMEQKKTHTFSYMVAYDREDLVSHPLIQASLNKKWQKFAAYLYYFKLLLYVCFLTSLTGYILVTAPLREPYRSKDCTIVQENATWEMIVFVHYGKFAVIILALLHLLFEIVQMIGQLGDYLQLDNLLEWIIYILAIANVIDDFIVLPFLRNGLICGMYQKSFGSLALFLSWLNFVLFMRKVPVFGIYIVMFLYVFKTFFKFFVVFIFFIATFAFAFFILLRDGQSPAFKNPWTSLVKVGVMMTGEMGFDELFFYGGGKVDPILWIIFIIFVLVLNIILMNLLVGLAVDDIAGVQKQAEMTKSTMQIDICLQAEITLPKMFRTRFVVKSQKLRPNKDDLPNNISMKSYIKIKEILLKSKEAENSVQDSLKALQHDMTQLTDRVSKINDELTDIELLNGKIYPI
uniref:Ion transport domain-containing protein n=2 Tax=Clytia hemisphaerica TaxID=252671 RepID=A0A7M5X847_9CNID